MAEKPDDIQRACRIGDLSMLKKAIEACPDGINSLDPKLGWSPLYRAVICGHVDLVRYLLQSGADPNVTNKLGETAMHQAADAGNYKITQALLEKRADPNLQQAGKDEFRWKHGVTQNSREGTLQGRLVTPEAQSEPEPSQ